MPITVSYPPPTSASASASSRARASRPAEFRKRLNYFIKMTAKNKQFGFGGIEKYY